MLNSFRKLFFSGKLKKAVREIRISVLIMYILIPFLAEFWHLFSSSNKQVDWFLFYDFQYDIKWAVHDVSYQLILLIFSIVALIWGWEKRSRRIIGVAMVVFALLDMLFLFINFKQWSLYVLVHLGFYTAELIGWSLYFRYKDKK